jgi:hypothetical protein
LHYFSQPFLFKVKLTDLRTNALFLVMVFLPAEAFSEP